MAPKRAIIASRHFRFSTIVRIGSSARRPQNQTSSRTAPKRLKRIRGAGNEKAQQQRQTVLGQGRLIHHSKREKPTCEVYHAPVRLCTRPPQQIPRKQQHPPHASARANGRTHARQRASATRARIGRAPERDAPEARERPLVLMRNTPPPPRKRTLKPAKSWAEVRRISRWPRAFSASFFNPFQGNFSLCHARIIAFGCAKAPSKFRFGSPPNTRPRAIPGCRLAALSGLALCVPQKSRNDAGLRLWPRCPHTRRLAGALTS